MPDPRGPVYSLACSGEKHRIVVGPAGLEFLDHGPEIWQHSRTQLVLDALSQEQPVKPDGCYHVAAIVTSGKYLDLSAPKGARVALARLWGTSVGRRHAKKLKRDKP